MYQEATLFVMTPAVAVSTDRSASTLYMTAAKAWYTVSRLIGCCGQASGALREKNERHTCTVSTCWSRMRRNLDTAPRSRRPKSWDSRHVPVVPLERDLYGEQTFENVLLEEDRKKHLVGNACTSTANPGCFIQYSWTISKWSESKRLKKNADSENL